jgi:hypothetical protein
MLGFRKEGNEEDRKEVLLYMVSAEVRIPEAGHIDLLLVPGLGQVQECIWL